MNRTTTAAIEALMTCITDGRAVQFHPNYCAEAKDAPAHEWDTSHHVSVIRPNGSRYRIAEFRHSAEAVFHCEARELVPALAAERDAAVADAHACGAEREAWKARAEAAELREAALLANNEAERQTLLRHNARHAVEVAELRDFIADFAAFKFDACYRHPASSPEDEGDDVTDAELVWAWQEDARAALAKIGGA